MIIHFSRWTILNFLHIESIALSAGEEVNMDAGTVDDLSMDGIYEVG